MRMIYRRRRATLRKPGSARRPVPYGVYTSWLARFKRRRLKATARTLRHVAPLHAPAVARALDRARNVAQGLPPECPF